MNFCPHIHTSCVPWRVSYCEYKQVVRMRAYQDSRYDAFGGKG